jgi:hypothetical protein
LRKRTYNVISHAELRDIGTDCSYDPCHLVTKHRRPVVDLEFPLTFYLIWRKDNQSALLQNFVAQVEAVVGPSGETR